MAISAGNSFRTRDKLNVGAQSFEIHRLEHLEKKGISQLAKLPFSLRILLENLLRCEDGRFVRQKTSPRWPNGLPTARKKKLPSCPRACFCRISPASPRSSISPPCAKPCRKWAAIPSASIRSSPPNSSSITPCKWTISAAPIVRPQRGTRIPAQRRALRVPPLGPKRFRNFKVVPPDTGICHQVNLEYLARVVCAMPSGNESKPIPIPSSAPIRTPP